MKKISLKSSIVAVSLSLALAPMAFAQSPASPQVVARTQVADTAPLPGARLASQFVEAGGGLTALGVAAVVALAVIGIVVASNASNDDINALLLTNTVTVTAP